MPCQLLPLAYSGGATAGMEFSVYRRFALTAEAGGFYDPGFLVKGDLKYYLPQAGYSYNRQLFYYLAVEYAYKEQAYAAADNLREPGTGKPGAEVNYSVYKFVNTVNLKYGCTVMRAGSKILRSFYTDVYAGAGIRYRVASNTLAPGEVAQLYHWNEGFIDNFTNSAGRGYTLAVSLGIKVGLKCK